MRKGFNRENPEENSVYTWKNIYNVDLPWKKEVKGIPSKVEKETPV